MSCQKYHHPQVSRRFAIQAGSVGLLGLGMNHVKALQAAPIQKRYNTTGAKAKKVIYIFLSGGLAQQDSFDMKPDAPDDIRGEFNPVSTATPGMQICEHLPELAKRSNRWSIVRSLTHQWNEHSQGHHIMLTGRTDVPTGFNPSAPKPTDFPAMAAIANTVTLPQNNLPPVAVLPERLVHQSGRIIPGQFAGQMGEEANPWFIEAASFHRQSYGAFPEYAFDHQKRDVDLTRKYEAPNLELPHGLAENRFVDRLKLVNTVTDQKRRLDQSAQTEQFDRYREQAITLLTDPKVQYALDVTNAEEKIQEQYGRNCFGWSLLMARRLVAAGVNMVQVNLGNDEAWDTHGNAFPHLKDNLFPPTDKAISALLDDLEATGELNETLIVMAGEFGRTPKISLLPSHYEKPGRDHHGALQTVWFAGGGVRGGNIVGKSDKHGGYPVDNPKTPEQMAATIYDALGIPATAAWYDAENRPHQIYHGEPIHELF